MLKGKITRCPLRAHLVTSCARLEDWHDCVIDIVLPVQNDHVGDPPNIANLLLAQFYPCVENAEVIAQLSCFRPTFLCHSTASLGRIRPNTSSAPKQPASTFH